MSEPVIIVTGSRYLRDMTRIVAALEYHASTDVLIVHGGASGADRIADAWAIHNGYRVHCFKADWSHLGMAAGPRRNRAMLDAYPDALVLAFPMGESKGTRQCIAAARDRGMRVIVFEMTDSERSVFR
jgi:hypothetical protein